MIHGVLLQSRSFEMILQQFTAAFLAFGHCYWPANMVMVDLFSAFVFENKYLL